ncbi:hypothetical protein RhiirA5_446879 [Rhizophagus irregularis]|uniref:Uncharacterized protein n=1 Tax=Rhizophagus irregularis TaxID=588596 RepID=A0A2N0NBH5_9GLOM|nr:hypothetical protein RhiirA5_446879 [Rhizophagus irregularis]
MTLPEGSIAFLALLTSPPPTAVFKDRKLLKLFICPPSYFITKFAMSTIVLALDTLKRNVKVKKTNINLTLI